MMLIHNSHALFQSKMKLGMCTTLNLRYSASQLQQRPPKLMQPSVFSQRSIPVRGSLRATLCA